MYSFVEWIEKEAQHHACLHQWSKKLLELGVSWESFRRTNKQEITDDLVQGGIPIVAARDIVTLAAKQLERSTAPMAIFWDLENVHIPTPISGRDLVNRIKTKLAPHGSLVQFRGYVSIGLNLIPPDKRSDLQLAGCHLVDCPHGGRKDVVDKMIIVDAMQFAYQQPANATICFITGDVDYAYLLAVLQQNANWRTIVISSRTVPTKLHENCHIKLFWETDFVEPILDDAQKNNESPECSMVGLSRPTLSSPEGQASNCNKSDNFSSMDRGLIRNTMLYLTRKSGTTRHLKSQVGVALQEKSPSRFPDREAIKSFFLDAIASGVVHEQGEGPVKTLTLAEQDFDRTTSDHSSLPRVKARISPPLLPSEERYPGIAVQAWKSRSNFSVNVDSSGQVPTPNLHVRGFGPSTTKQHVYNLFRNFVKVLEIVEKSRGGNRFMFVNTTSTKDAILAKQQLQGVKLNDGTLIINFAKVKV